MQRKNILFVSHSKQKCGVYQFGKNVFDVIKHTSKYNIQWAECDTLTAFYDSMERYSPDAIIYNFHPATMPWLTTKLAPRVYKSNISHLNVMQIGIIHEITQAISDGATNYRNPILFHKPNKHVNKLFDFYISADPTLLLQNPYVYKTGRLIPEYHNKFSLPEIPTIGSYGFGTPNKGFENIVEKVQDEFDSAIIRLNIPFADFGDNEGKKAMAIAQNCRSLVRKSGIRLEISHDFLEKKDLLDFLARNTINVFLYNDKQGRGLSSAIDNALAVQRPICVSESTMFRHVLELLPNISSDKNTLAGIISSGFEPFHSLVAAWDKTILRWEYERILDSAFMKYENPRKVRMGIIRTVQSYFRRFLSLPDKSFTWLRNTKSISEDSVEVDKSIHFKKVNTSEKLVFNRILDNDARELYSDVIKQMIKVFPNTMSKKIPEANVQQAFVLDTVFRNLKNIENPKILCVGSYEDTASMFLRKIGLAVEEIDPMINYYLQEFVDKPSTIHGSYDIIFSTSVIEHDPNDESFIECIYRLLAPGGIVVITCDYNDQWRPGDLKPDVDERLYTHFDLQDRLIKLMPDCLFVDTPNWDCPNPDFLFLGKYRYAFASFVVKKKS
jgi:Methyltransferase domain